MIAIENANLLAALKESDQRKDEFLAMLAHEIRNPLARIRNAVEIFRGAGPLIPDLQWGAEVIDRQVAQLTRLVDDLLDVSRITSGKIQIRKQRVELSAVVNSALDASRPLIEDEGHAFTLAMPPGPIYLDADLVRLRQVLLNLLNNAAKYTEHGGRIWLTIEREGDQVLLRVRDTGMGISAEMLPRVFDMFTQVDRSLERSRGGLGIGLMLVQRLVELHGGTVRAHSDGPGKGSEFIVTLPVAVGIGAEQAPAAVSHRDEGSATGGCRILIVDDNRDSADSLAMLLKRRGYEVRTAHDGVEAIGAAKEFEPDLALLDLGLPKLNGYDAARRLRGDRGDSIVWIAVTGWGQQEDRRRSKEAGFDHHMTKPVDLGALYRLLAAVPSTGRRARREPDLGA